MGDHWENFFERSYLSEERGQRAQTNRYGDKITERIVANLAKFHRKIILKLLERVHYTFS